MISKNNERIAITINKDLLSRIDKRRGWWTRTQYICTAIDEKLQRDQPKKGARK